MSYSGNTPNRDVNKSADYIKAQTNLRPKIALVLGSGLGSLIQKIEDVASFDFSEIPDFPISSVEGHAGKLIFGNLKSKNCSIPVLAFQGRIHFYETGSMEQVLFPVFLAGQIGIEKLIITNAAGGINSRFNAGDLMLIRDIFTPSHIRLPNNSRNFLFQHQKHFDYFDEEMNQNFIRCASKSKMTMHIGNYCWLTGPSYETPAEIRMLKKIGADAVGMSTVPEVFLAHNLGIKTVAVSFISNLAAGISLKKLSHADVTRAGSTISEQFAELMQQYIFSLA
ncbi:MAG: purine-nucleoside phosphorylase [Bacteroidetes bacterium]|nr:purine-nucleoside phosphorylase [Bacteroidota bacterium]